MNITCIARAKVRDVLSVEWGLTLMRCFFFRLILLYISDSPLDRLVPMSLRHESRVDTRGGNSGRVIPVYDPNPFIANRTRPV